MTLAPGTKLGSYEILAPIGAGGMGDAGHAPGPHGGDQESQGAAQRKVQAGRANWTAHPWKELPFSKRVAIPPIG